MVKSDYGRKFFYFPTFKYSYYYCRFYNRKAEGARLASSHGNILFQLSVNEKMTMGDLAEKINRDKSTTTVLVRKLEKDGFITGESDPADKRSRVIYLTEKGKDFNQTAHELSNELLSTFYKGFSEEEKNLFFQSLLKVKENFSTR